MFTWEEAGLLRQMLLALLWIAIAIAIGGLAAGVFAWRAMAR
jgi:hypothetical protein